MILTSFKIQGAELENICVTLLYYLSSIAFILTKLITYGHAVYISLGQNLSILSVIKITANFQGHVTILLLVAATFK
jgi:hypothetical protein